jgi:MATE family multidrug resistance protein
MTYVIPMAIGSAASIRIGFLVGEQDFRGAQQTAYAVFKFSIIYAIVVSALLIGFRYQLVSLYTTDEAVIGIAVVLLLFIALYQLADDTQAVIVSSLRGYKDTKVPMIISMLSYWFLGLPLGHSLASGLFGFPELGVFGYWIGLSVGLAVVAVFAGLRLRRISGDWHRVRKLSGLSAT